MSASVPVALKLLFTPTFLPSAGECTQLQAFAKETLEKKKKKKVPAPSSQNQTFMQITFGPATAQMEERLGAQGAPWPRSTWAEAA